MPRWKFNKVQLRGNKELDHYCDFHFSRFNSELSISFIT